MNQSSMCVNCWCVNGYAIVSVR